MSGIIRRFAGTRRAQWHVVGWCMCRETATLKQVLDKRFLDENYGWCRKTSHKEAILYRDTSMLESPDIILTMPRRHDTRFTPKKGERSHLPNFTGVVGVSWSKAFYKVDGTPTYTWRVSWSERSVGGIQRSKGFNPIKYGSIYGAYRAACMWRYNYDISMFGTSKIVPSKIPKYFDVACKNLPVVANAVKLEANREQ